MVQTGKEKLKEKCEAKIVNIFFNWSVRKSPDVCIRAFIIDQ